MPSDLATEHDKRCERYHETENPEEARRLLDEIWALEVATIGGVAALDPDIDEIEEEADGEA